MASREKNLRSRSWRGPAQGRAGVPKNPLLNEEIKREMGRWRRKSECRSAEIVFSNGYGSQRGAPRSTADPTVTIGRRFPPSGSTITISARPSDPLSVNTMPRGPQSGASR
jgi:hypothetical protein